MLEVVYGRWSAAPFHLAAALGTFLLCALARYYYQLRRYSYPATVWPIVPLIGDAFQFLYTPFSYFRRCRSTYGPVFKCVIGDRRMVVVCDVVGIQAVLRDKTRALATHSIHSDVCASIANVDPKASHYLPDLLLPLSGDFYSMTGLIPIIPVINRWLYDHIEGMKRPTSTHHTMSLSQFVGEALYNSVSIAVFGDKFPLSTYRDFEAIDYHFANLMSGLPFLTRSIKSHRAHIIAKAGEYIDEVGSPEAMGALPEPAKKIISILSDPELSRQDRDGLMVIYIWGLHSSMIRVSFWLFTYLLNDLNALRLLRDEIDQTLSRDFKDINALLAAPPGTLDGPGFTYLASVVKEALRISSVIAPVREVIEDTVIPLSTGESVPLRKGEFVTANIPMYHYDVGDRDSSTTFQADRYLTEDINGRKAPYLPWGGGEHVCKGRFLALHTLKMFTILVLRSLDLSAVSQAGKTFEGPPVRYETTFIQRWRMTPRKPFYIRASARSLPRQVVQVESEDGKE